MTIAHNMYDTATLLGVMREFAPVPSYWRDLFFTSQITFTDEYIDFEKLVEGRKLAPFVAPLNQGRPVYTESSTVTRLKPAYIKAKDVLDPARVIRKRPGELAGNQNVTPLARKNALIADILRTQREAIERRLEWMSARAIIDGQVTISGEGYPERLVNFNRASNHTVTLSGGAVWSTSSDIIADLNAWRKRVRNAQFGGVTNRLTVGADAWDVMSRNAGIKDQLDTQVRGTKANINTGLRAGENVEYVGDLGGLDVYVYSDYYQDESGSSVPIMSSKDVVLTGPNVMGVAAYGAILDTGAQLQAYPMYPKQWDEQDPSVTQVMTQSAPLMVPVNPNNTLKATVLA